MYCVYDMSFRFNAQKVFLTYSQTKKNMHPQWVLKQISAIAEIEEYLISQERHEDGGYHIHGYFKFTKKLDTKNPRFFDLAYYRKGYHPNIQKPKSRYKLFRYIKKDKQFITNIDETRPPWQVLLEETDNESDFLTELMWTIGRIDNYAGYRTLRDLATLKFEKNHDTDSLSVSEYIANKLK